MPAKTLLFLAASAMGAAMVAAQAAPNWRYIPAACKTACAQTAQVSYLCETQYNGDTTNIYGCFCNSYPSDAATCATCLNTSDAPALGKLLTSTATACPDAIKSCFFQCSFDTCLASDIACQCSASYLQNIYNCGSCNTANGNTRATQLKDFTALQASCKNQNYAGADGNFATKPLASATGQAGYTPVTLTAEGGGVAAAGGAGITAGAGGSNAAAGGAGVTAGAGGANAAAGGVTAAPAVVANNAAGGATNALAAGTAPATIAVGAASAANSGSAAVANASGGISAATTSKAAAHGLAVPATGLLAALGAVAAML